MLSAFGNVGFITIAVDIVLSATRTRVDGLPTTVPLGSRGVVLCTRTGSTVMGIDVTRSGIIVVIRGVLGAAIVFLHICAV